MGTAKRERQKANRQLRLEELAKQARKDKTKRFGMRIAFLVGGVVALVAIIYFVGKDDNSSSSTGTTVPTTLLPIVAPDKPTVSVPAELPTELKVTTLTEGSGPKAQNGDFVRVYYVGVFTKDGTEFDSNYTKGSPFDVTLGAGGVIKGWDQGLVGTQAGGRYQLDIPSDLAYGPDDYNGIPGGSALTFVVDVVAVTPANPVTTDSVTATS